jgi:hypothetical protein
VSNSVNNLKASLNDQNERINNLADVIIAGLDDQPELLKNITTGMIEKFDL